MQTDLEGVSGCTGGGYGFKLDPTKSARYLELMMGEINAVVEGCVQAGADEIIVNEAHAIDLASLHPAAKLARGIRLRNLLPMREFTHAMFVGQHARTGLRDAVRSHTGSSKSITGFWINERPCGEFAYVGGLLGERGVPIVFLSGDSAACQEAEDFVPGIKTVAVEESESVWGAICLPPAKTQPMLQQGATEALQLKNIKPLLFDCPVTIKVEYAYPMIADEHARVPGCVRVDDRSVSYSADTFDEAYRGGVEVLAAILYKYDVF
ncbi:MAG: M55 family metallopeptidase [Lentisphaeria bacterium]